MRRLIGVGMAVALLLVSQPAVADDPLSAVCRVVRRAETQQCGEGAVGAHALYFIPITCPYAYASVFNVIAIGTDSQRGRAQLVPCRADWGFRLFGNYFDDCMFAGVSYQWFEATAARSITADNLRVPGALTFGPGRATGQVRIEYQNVDVRVGKTLHRGCTSSFYLYGNARWIDLSHSRAARGDFVGGPLVRTQEKSQLRGGAIGIGLGGECDILCGIGAFVDGNILGVIGNRSLTNVEFKGSTPFFTPQIRRASYPSETCVIPEADFRVGINYTYPCGCWTLVGELGYEVDYFWNGSIFPTLTGVNLGLGNTQDMVPVCEDLGFSGLFFGARLIF